MSYLEDYMPLRVAGIGLALLSTALVGLFVFQHARAQLRLAQRSTRAATVFLALALFGVASVASGYCVLVWARTGENVRNAKMLGRGDLRRLIAADEERVELSYGHQSDAQLLEVARLRQDLSTRRALEWHSPETVWESSYVSIVREHHRALDEALSAVGPRITWRHYMAIERHTRAVETVTARLHARHRALVLEWIIVIGGISGLCLLTVHLRCRRRIG